MRHRKRSVKLGRTTSHRKAMFRNMVTSLLSEERIETTVAKAKEARRLTDDMVTLAKRGTLHARRQALSFVRDEDVVRKLFSTLAARYADRNGGYTRIIRTAFRRGDGSQLAILEMVGRLTPEPKAEKKKARKAKKTAKASEEGKPAEQPAAEEEPEKKPRARRRRKKKESEEK